MAGLTVPGGVSADELADLKTTVQGIVVQQGTAEALEARAAAIDAQAARVDRMVSSAQTQMASVRAQQTTVTELTSEVTVTLESVRAAQVLGLARLDALEKEQTAAAERARLLEARVAALEARTVLLARGQAATPLIGLGLKADVVVTLSKPMPSAVFEVEAQPAAALLGKVTVAVKSKTATSVTLTVAATAAVTLTASVDVIAWRLS